jgi:hypothetical protein
MLVTAHELTTLYLEDAITGSRQYKKLADGARPGERE